MSTKVRLSERDDRWEITLADPPLHILDIELLEQLRDLLGRVPNDRALLVIQSEGQRAFSAGASVPDHSADRVDRMLTAFHDCFRILDKLEVVSVAVVNGVALGGGCELAFGCDLVLASETARFGQPEIKLGVFAPVASYQLARLLPPRIGLELLLTGEPIDAARAASLGLVNAVLPEPFSENVEKWLQQLTRHSASSLRLAKRAFRTTQHAHFTERLAEVEALYMKELMQTSDATEGLAAFMEKRAARWTHR